MRPRAMVRREACLSKIEELDKAFDQATTPQEQGKIAADKAEVLLTIAQRVSTPEDRSQWVRQAADFMSATVQSGVWPMASTS